jgi:hypothetical protein
MTIVLGGGGAISIARFDGERAEGTADRALPPGSRPTGAIEGQSVRLKVERCAALGAGFRVRVRFLDLERELREKILAAVAQPGGGSPGE